MPLFKWGKDGKSDRTKLQRKLYLAQENPDHIFDLSDCGLKDVPSGVFSKCRVFRKTELLLHTNRITSVEGGGQLRDLFQIEVLDLHSNNLRSLPESIGALTHLKVLDLKCNIIEKLPDTFGSLAQLEVLNLQANKFKEFPVPVLNLRRLRHLDISNNEIDKLPANFFELSRLKELNLDSEKFVFPDAAVCGNSVEAIMHFLCQESGVEYSSLNKQEDETDREIEGTQMLEDTATENQFKLYEARRERRRIEMMEMEAQLQEATIVNAELIEDSSERKRQLLLDIAREQDELHDSILVLQNQKDKERKKLLSLLSQLEKHSAALIEQISANIRSETSDALRWAMELERLETEVLCGLKHQEMDVTKKKEILNSMVDILHQEELQMLQSRQRETLLKGLQEDDIATARLLEDVIATREGAQKVLADRILQEEGYQREAFRTLQLKNDKTHSQILQEIQLVEKELSKLTEVERKKRDLKVTTELDGLSSHRIELAMLLSVLLGNKALREKQLQEYMREMEKKRQTEMIDFWLRQYERLLEQKPPHVQDMEVELDPRIINALLTARAEHYIPVLAARHITWDQLASMEPEGLRRLGVTSESAVNSLMAVISSSLPEAQKVAPTAPCPESPRKTPLQGQMPSVLEVRLWQSSECVVCLDVKTLLVFLPCGHVCCCQDCGAGICQCPLCRVDVESRLHLL